MSIKLSDFNVLDKLSNQMLDNQVLHVNDKLITANKFKTFALILNRKLTSQSIEQDLFEHLIHAIKDEYGTEISESVNQKLKGAFAVEKKLTLRQVKEGLRLAREEELKLKNKNASPSEEDILISNAILEKQNQDMKNEAISAKKSKNKADIDKKQAAFAHDVSASSEKQKGKLSSQIVEEYREQHELKSKRDKEKHKKEMADAEQDKIIQKASERARLLKKKEFNY